MVLPGGSSTFAEESVVFFFRGFCSSLSFPFRRRGILGAGCRTRRVQGGGVWGPGCVCGFCAFFQKRHPMPIACRIGVVSWRVVCPVLLWF